MATKKQLQGQLDEADANYSELSLQKAVLEEELRVAKLRADLVFVVSDNAQACLEQAFGPLTGGLDKSAGVHRYEAAEQLASITFVPITGEVFMADPKRAIAEAKVQLSPSGELSELSAQLISAFLDDVEFSRRPRRATQAQGPISFVRPAPTKDVSVPGDTPRAATDEEAAAEQALDGIKY